MPKVRVVVMNEEPLEYDAVSISECEGTLAVWGEGPLDQAVKELFDAWTDCHLPGLQIIALFATGCWERAEVIQDEDDWRAIT